MKIMIIITHKSKAKVTTNIELILLPIDVLFVRTKFWFDSGTSAGTNRCIT